ncbi:MAG: 4Fe-4S binding protein [Pseudohongiellaceae bacterium]
MPCLIYRCRITSLALLLLMPCTFALAQGADQWRTPFDTTVQPAWLFQVVPQAERFSEKQGEPPVYRAYRSDANGEESLVGFAFLSSDLPPEEKGYSAPLAMLIGMDLDLAVTGLKVLDYRDSYRYSRGDFVADAAFLQQFSGKSIMDDFRLGNDIDGLSGATITSFGISRGARNAARRVAAAYLDYQQGSAEMRASARNALAQLRQTDWPAMVADGTVQQAIVPMPIGSLELSVTYMGRQVLGEYLIGAEDYASAERDASARFGGEEMLLLAVGGEAATQFRMERLALRQGDSDRQAVDPRRFVSAGNADAGALAGHAAYAGAIVLDESIDLNQPIEVIYRPPGQFEGIAIPYQLEGLNLKLYNGEPILSAAEIAHRQMLAADLLTRLRYGPPWANSVDSDVPWSSLDWIGLSLLAIILGLAMAAFLSKRSAIRWVTLLATLCYLGFIDGGFLSISHLTSALGQGVSQIANNLPLLMLVVFTLITTLLWGRVFCSSLCPFGAVQDVLTALVPKRWLYRPPAWFHERAIYLKYAILAVLVLLAITHSELSLFQFFEPFGTLFFFSSSVVLWAILLLTLGFSLVIPRFYCRYLCPLGAALGTLSLLSPLRIERVPQCQVCKMCEQACPTGAIHGADIDFKECVRCDICEAKLIARAGSCRHDLDVIQMRLESADGRS